MSHTRQIARFMLLTGACAVIGCGLFKTLDRAPTPEASEPCPVEMEVFYDLECRDGVWVMNTEGECNPDTECDYLPPDDDCQTRTCVDDGVCGQDFVAESTVVNAPLQETGNCKIRVCDGAGEMMDIPYAIDVFVDNEECTFDVCIDGTASNPPKNQGTGCGSKSVCDGAGKCVGCNEPTDCTGTDDFCKTRTDLWGN
jgi:hypothetical protein